MLKDSDIRYSFNAGEWSRLLNGRMDLDRYSASCRQLKNAFVYNEGPMSRRPGFINLLPTREDASGRIIPFVFSQTEAYVLEFTVNKKVDPEERRLRFWKNDALVQKSGGNYTITHPFSLEELPDVRFKQIQDIMWMVHPNHKPRQLRRYADDDWEFVEIEFLDGPYGPENTNENITITAPQFQVGTYSLTASQAVFSADDVGKSIYFRERSGSLNYREWAPNQSVTVGDIRLNAGYIYMAMGTGTTGNIPPTWTGTPYFSTANGPFSDGVIDWVVLNNGRGWARIIFYTSPTVVLVEVERALPPSMSTEAGTVTPQPSYRWAKSSWGDNLGYPRAVHFLDNRIVFLDNDYINMSKVGEYDVFSPGTEPDDAVQIRLTDKNFVEALWLSINRAITVGSPEGVYVLNQDPTNQTITPENLPKSRRLSNKKSSPIEPVYAETSSLYVGKGEKSLYGLDYSIEVDGLKTVNMTVFANHILKPRVKEIAWQERPQGTLWCVLHDGTFASMAYEFSQEVVAWVRHDTQGQVISLAVVPNPDPDDDREVVYVMVKRTVGGSERIFIERMSNFVDAEELTSINSVFYDSCRIYSGPARSYIDGLFHLEGEEVWVWTESGGEGQSFTVVDSRIDLPETHTYIVAGLPYTTEFLSPRIRSSVSESASMYAIKSVSSVYMEFLNTGECYIGTSLDMNDLSLVKHFETADVGVLDENENLNIFPLKSGVSKAQIKPKSSRGIEFAISSGPNSGSPINVLHYAVQFGASAPI